MKTYAIPLWLIYTTLGYCIVLLCGFGFFLFKWIKKFFMDSVIFIDKNNRWKQVFLKLRFRNTLDYGDSRYNLDANAGLLNARGKVLYHFSENKPTPLTIGYNKAQWIDANTLKAMIKNELIKQIVKPSDKFTDMLMIFGAIGGLIAGISSVIILLITTGVIS